ncbi:fungal-specific transcription factor domain-containing protein [Aspergillus bertholletiae]|uniref:Fungal-specific transcription factor domain-containing protein n=1 Tax=Aspergillus bertholletiae TaxID=1226010 RepID=A0A5N7AYL7_9EURO|nr:fungal-specific transcription factor domain-containing protein [Aspergillus bertholletiae]
MESALQQNRSGRRFRPKVPISQRKRTERACNRCRTRKRKCRFAQSDVCQNCQRDGHSCILQPVESSPDLLDPAIKDIADKFRLLHPEASLKPHHWDTLAGLFGYRVNAPNGHSTVEDDSMATQDPGVSRDAGNTPLDEPSTSARQEQSGLLGFGKFLTSASSTLSQSHSLDLSQDRIGYGFPLDYTVLYNTTKEQCLIDILTRFPTQAEADFIISTFFLYVSSNWYFLDEAGFRNEITHLYESNLDASCVECDFLYLVLMVFALGSQFIELREASAPVDQTISPSQVNNPPGVQFFRSAVTLLPLVLSISSLESCQGLFLTGLYLLPMSQSSTSYTYIALAMRMATGLDLHQDDTRSTLSPKQLEYRHRIFWAFYSIERGLAVALGYPENIQEREIRCPRPQFQQDLDTNDPLQVKRLIAFVNLTLITNRLLRHREKGPWSSYLHESQTSLLSWWRDLPIELRTLENIRLRVNAHLHMHYHQMWIHVSRESLIFLLQSRLRNRTSPIDDERDNPAIHELSKHCVESANQVIDLLNLLRVNGQLSHFSFTDFHACVSATIILLLGSVLDPCVAASHQVQAAMDILQFMAAGNGNAKGGFRLLESFLAIVNTSLSSLRARQSPEGPLDAGIEIPGAQQTQQQCRPYSLESNHLLSPTQHSHPILESVPDSSPTTIPGGTSEPNLGQSSGRSIISLYDDIRAVLNECSSDEIRLLGVSSLFEENSPQVFANEN